MSKKRSYHDDWDEYVDNCEFYAPKEPTYKVGKYLSFPGDEWGDKEYWERITNTYLKPYLPENSTGIAVEIGSGSGKYTLEIVDCVSKIICFDVSRKFMEIAKTRLREYVDRGKVYFEFLELLNCYEIKILLTKHRVVGKVDLFFSIDSMVHVELHTLIAYFLNAAICLKVGGHMVMTVAGCTNNEGFERLLGEMPWCYGGTRPSHQFYFLSKDIIEFCLEKLGFEILECEQERDILFVAKKTEKAEIKTMEAKTVFAENQKSVEEYLKAETLRVEKFKP